MKTYPIALTVLGVVLATGCGKSPVAGNVTLQSAPLAGPNAASIGSQSAYSVASIADTIGSTLLGLLVGSHDAYAAAVASFSSFKICNDTLVMTDVNGNTVPINGSTNQAGVGLLTFSSASTSSTVLGLPLNIASGTQIKEIDITSAVNTALCPGFPDAVAFDPGTGAVHISQNTAFKFKYANPLTITGSSQNLNLLFGQIVNGMVSLGVSLNNSTIQTVNVGQAM